MNNQFKDNEISNPIPGFVALFVILTMNVVFGFLAISSLGGNIILFGLFVLLGLISLFLYSGLKTINPGEAVLLTFFGDYVGTVKQSGFFWFNVFYNVQNATVKQVNRVTEVLKINDASGNPIEVAATISYSINDVAKSIFAVENTNNFVKNQCDASLRQVVSKYHYDSEDHSETTLRSNSQIVSEELKKTLAQDLQIAGIVVHNAKLSHLAYAPEIASAMLRRQQAEAVISARKKIVEGAVSMVEMAIKEIEEKDIAVFSPEQKTQLVNNLMTVLVSEDKAQPVVTLKIKHFICSLPKSRFSSLFLLIYFQLFQFNFSTAF